MGSIFCSYTNLAFDHVLGTLICIVCNAAKAIKPRFKGMMDNLGVHAHHFLRRVLEATSPSLLPAADHYAHILHARIHKSWLA